MLIVAIRSEISPSRLVGRNDLDAAAYESVCHACDFGLRVVLERRNITAPRGRNLLPGGILGRSESAGVCWLDVGARALVFTTWA